MYSFMTVRALQVELRRRNASGAGKKADLIQMLDAYDRNLLEDRSYACPSSDIFRYINADSPIPNITKHELQEYFQSSHELHQIKQITNPGGEFEQNIVNNAALVKTLADRLQIDLDKLPKTLRMQVHNNQNSQLNTT